MGRSELGILREMLSGVTGRPLSKGLPSNGKGIVALMLGKGEGVTFDTLQRHLGADHGALMHVVASVQEHLTSRSYDYRITRAKAEQICFSLQRSYRQERHYQNPQTDQRLTIDGHKDTDQYQTATSAPSFAQQEEWKAEERRISGSSRDLTIDGFCPCQIARNKRHKANGTAASKYYGRCSCATSRPTTNRGPFAGLGLVK